MTGTVPRRGGPVLVPQSKVRSPRARDGLLLRKALVREAITDPAEALVVLAPAGFGKTTFVAQWATAAGRPIAWATVGEVDSDPVVLMSTLLAALEASDVYVELPAGTLTGDEPAFSRRALPAFQRSLETLSGPVTLVVDDIHAMVGVRSALVLSAVLDSLPDGSQLALVGRSRPDLPIELWSGRGRIRRVGPTELAFDEAEAAQFVARVMRRTPTDSEVRELIAATNGWPVAIYLSAIAMREGVSQVSSDDAVGDYLSAEVMDLLEPGLRDFLRDCSILAGMTASLCDAVIESSTSAARLRQAESATLLVSRLEGEGEWFRLHPLLRTRLRKELDEQPTKHRAALNARASSWYEQHGFTDDSIAHAVQADDLEALGNLVWAHAPDALMLGRRTTVSGWLATLDQRDMVASPGLALTAAWTGMVRGDSAAVGHWADVASHALGPGWQEHLDRSTMEPALLLLAALAGAGGYQAASDAAGWAVDAFPMDDGMRTLALLSQGLLSTLSGRVRAGIDILERGLREAESMSVGTSTVEACALLAAIHVEAGAWSTAEHHVRSGHRAWVAYDLQDVMTSSGLLFSAVALVAARHGHGSEARSALTRTEPVVAELGSALPWAPVLLDAHAARTLALIGDDGGAAARLRRARNGLTLGPESSFLEETVRNAEAEVLAASPLASLTPAERRVWDHLGERLTVKELGATLFLSPDTVKTHLASIYRKLGVSSRREAQAIADSLQGR